MTRSISSDGAMVLSSWAGSGMIHWKWRSPVNSSMEERARGCRRSDLEKNKISAVAVISDDMMGIKIRHTLPELSVHLSSEYME